VLPLSNKGGYLEEIIMGRITYLLEINELIQGIQSNDFTNSFHSAGAVRRLVNSKSVYER